MVLDTNILIAYLGGDAGVVAAVRDWFSENVTLFISAVTYAEVLALPAAGTADLAIMQMFLDSFVLIPLDRTIAEETAAIRRRHKLKFPDAAILATALYTKSILVTRDKRLHKIAGVTALTV
jgi:hypothetical protein